MQATYAGPVKGDDLRAPCRRYRVERCFSPERPAREMVRDLLRAHSGGQGTD